MAEKTSSSPDYNFLANPTQVDALGSITKGLNAASAMNQNLLFQAQQATGAASQGAINQQTGEYDPNKFRQLLVSAGPVAAPAARAALESNQALSTSQLDQAFRKIGFIHDAASALERKGDNVGLPDVLGVLQQGAASGILTLPEIQHQLSTVPTDAAGIQDWVKQHQAQAMTVQQRLEQTYGTRQQVQTGPNVQFPVVPAARSGGSGPVVPMDLSPEAASAPTKIGTDATGKDIMATARQARNLAEGRSLNDNGPPPQSPIGTGRLPDALRNPKAPTATPEPNAAPSPNAAPPPPGVNPLPGGGYTVGQGTAQKAAQTEQGLTSAKEFQSYAVQDVQAQNQVALLGNMLADTQKFVPGSGAPGVKAFKQAMTSWAPQLAASFGISPESVAAIESFDKLRAQILTSQGAATDHRMDVLGEGTPSSSLTPQGVDLILRQLQGNSDYIRARARLAAEYPDKTDHAAFQNSIRDLDPRAFQFARMTAAQKLVYDKTLSPEDRKTVAAAYKYAHDRSLF